MKKFEDFNVSDYDHNWQVLKNDNIDSWWEYKSDAIDRIIEIIDLEGDNGLEEYKYEDDELTLEEIRDMLEDESEEDFYVILDELKKFSECSDDFMLYNISDEDEIEFLKDDAYFNEFD